MENDLFLINAGIAAPPPLLHYDHPSDCFWDKPHPPPSNLDVSLASSPSPSASAVSADTFVIRELIGKLASGRPHNSATPGIIDPGFAERAARLSCFSAGSRSFNARAVPSSALPRVCSSPSLKEPNRAPAPAAVSQDESTVSEQRIAGGETTANPRKRKASPKAKASYSTKAVENEDEENNSNAKRNKGNEGNANDNSGDEKQAKASPKPPEPPKDYIHVRARRGQATDSHSLAERVRREKISERMKLLQDLVPGCNKVTGKALMLDEIINYVQSLQRQVEFLSMKLASVNTRLDGNIDTLMSKDVFQSNNTMTHPIFPLDSSAQSIFGHQPHQNQNQNQALHSGPMSHCPMDSLDLQFPQLSGFTDFVSQYPIFGEDDLQSIVQMGFGQNPSLQPQSIHGQNQVSHMKIEL